jgi:hypothetical protein
MERDCSCADHEAVKVSLQDFLDSTAPTAKEVQGHCGYTDCGDFRLYMRDCRLCGSTLAFKTELKSEALMTNYETILDRRLDPARRALIRAIQTFHSFKTEPARVRKVRAVKLIRETLGSLPLEIGRQLDAHCQQAVERRARRDRLAQG